MMQGLALICLLRNVCCFVLALNAAKLIIYIYIYNLLLEISVFFVLNLEQLDCFYYITSSHQC